MQTLNYTANWNGKLFADMWNDVRLADADKFYHGAELEILFKNKPIGIAEVIVVKKFQFRYVNDILAYIDIGKPAQYLAGMLKKYYAGINPDTVLDHMILKWIKRDIDAQAELMKAWWESKIEEVNSIQQKQA